MKINYVHDNMYTKTKTNDNPSAIYKKLWNIMKAVPGGKFIGQKSSSLWLN